MKVLRLSRHGVSCISHMYANVKVTYIKNRKFFDETPENSDITLHSRGKLHQCNVTEDESNGIKK